MEPITAVLLAKPFGQFVNKLLQPIYRKIENELSGETELVIHRLFNSYADYLQQSVERHSYFVSVVFQNEQRKLMDYYQPLTLLDTRTKEETKITEFPTAAVERTKRMLIVDTAGMGKTTLLKFLFLKCVKDEQGVPIFVELRKLSRKKELLDYVLEQLSDLEGRCKSGLFYKLISRGGFTFFFDGYDEIPDSERAEVTASIQRFIEKAPENNFLMTSRDEAGLLAFAQFQRYTIKPLEKSEAYSLLRKYADSTLADSLIAKLELPENQAIHEFLENPLLTSLLFKSFEYKHIIPLKRHIFYRQVYEALYESHDLTKEGGEFQRTKKSGLDVDRFELVLRALGAITYKASNTEFTDDAALEFVKQAKDLCTERKATSSSIIHDATHAVPLLVRDGNYIRWSHRSIQEYFAAKYLCKNTQGRHLDALLDYYNGPDLSKHMNLVLLCADIDRSVFDRSIGCQIAKDLLAEYGRLYAGTYPLIGKSIVEQRRRLCVGKAAVVVNHDGSLSQGIEEDESIHRLAQMLIEQCSEVRATGTIIFFSQPGIGFALTKYIKFFQDAKGRIDLPFISDPGNCVSLTSDQALDWPEDELIKITDSPENPLNSTMLFEATTRLIALKFSWTFDPDAARNYISEVENDARSQTESQPW